MMPPGSDPSCAARGLLEPSGHVRLVTRNLTFAAEGQTSLASQASLPSALDLLVGAVVADLLAGLRREATRAGVKVHDAELSVSAFLENPLVALGVVGEAGSPALASIRGSLYVSCDAGAETLEALWQSTLARAPVHSTLRRCSDVRIDLKPVS